MTASVLEHDIDDEPTIACRYMLYSEAPGGELHVRQPLCDSEPPESGVATRWVLVKRPSEAPPPSAEPGVELPQEPNLVVRLVRPLDLPRIELDEG